MCVYTIDKNNEKNKTEFFIIFRVAFHLPKRATKTEGGFVIYSIKKKKKFKKKKMFEKHIIAVFFFLQLTG